MGTLYDWPAVPRCAHLARRQGHAHQFPVRTGAGTAELASKVTGTLVTPTQLGSARELVYAEPDWSGRTLHEFRDESFRCVLAAAGETAAAVAERLSAVYYKMRDRTMLPYEETDEVLAELRERGFTLIAGTDSNAALAQYEF